MYFLPRNRHLLIEEITEEYNEQSTILLPEDYTPDESPHVIVEVMEYSPDCNIEPASHYAVVNKNMIEDIEIAGGYKYKLILENYVLGFVEKE